MTDKEILSIFYKWLSIALDKPSIKEPTAWAMYKTYEEYKVG